MTFPLNIYGLFDVTFGLLGTGGNLRTKGDGGQVLISDLSILDRFPV